LAAGTYAPTAKNLLATAIPTDLPSLLRPTIENVMILTIEGLNEPVKNSPNKKRRPVAKMSTFFI
jgi:hypothetical protein